MYIEKSTLTQENLHVYETQLQNFHIPQELFDLSKYMGHPVNEIQQRINAIRLSKHRQNATRT